ncbi:GspH/FimT family pseudopilin [Marinobacter mobilis]|uniref:Type II secretion system protein H n=1 Tax=Marinobacter mobilis TaxID=488533 RepID=A0A1H3B4K7_9GAMM|nr:GspH/FimT family pseudopilin [Marinobacter mobilis]SDX36877.1 type IV fimbrial biogenesis protein FimT [Marinobacter mobilis]
MNFLKKSRGFTLIELIVTIAVFGVIIALAAPSFQNMVISNRVAFDRDEFFNLLQFARSEAIKNGTAVTICKSSNGSSCDNSLGWNGGWLLFADTDRDGVLDASGDKVIKSVDPLEGLVVVTQSNGDNLVTFESRGLLIDGDGVFTFSHSAGAQFTKSVDLGITGRATKG